MFGWRVAKFGVTGIYSVEMLGVGCTLDTKLFPPKVSKKYMIATLKFGSSIR